jgi:hypothetical protein
MAGAEGVGSHVDFVVNAAPQPAPVIRGIVHEAGPRPGLALAGVHVEIAGGPYAGQATTTNYDGYFEFFGIQQTGFDLWASKRGYEPARFRVVQLPRDSAPDIRLTGQFRLATQRVEGTFAPECYVTGCSRWSGGSTRSKNPSICSTRRRRSSPIADTNR